MSELTIDQAVEIMDAPKEEQGQEAAIEAPAEVEEDSPSTEGEGTGEVEEPGDGEEEAEEVATDEDAEEAEADPVDAPNWWDAEAKAKFAELPTDLQEIVRAQEDKREAITQKAKAEAAEARKAADARATELASVSERASQAIAKAEQTLRSRWDGVTPEVFLEIAKEDPTEAYRLKLEYDADMAEVQALREAEAKAAEAAQKEHFRIQGEELQRINPKLASDAKLLTEVGNYIVQSGIPPEAISMANASELDIAYKAMLWDKAQAKAKTAIESPKIAKLPAKSVRPVASQESGSSLQREIQKAQNRLAQTKSLDDAVALMELEARAKRRA